MMSASSSKTAGANPRVVARWRCAMMIVLTCRRRAERLYLGTCARKRNLLDCQSASNVDPGPGAHKALVPMEISVNSAGSMLGADHDPRRSQNPKKIQKIKPRSEGVKIERRVTATWSQSNGLRLKQIGDRPDQKRQSKQRDHAPRQIDRQGHKIKISLAAQFD
jgi:hypothetical protein